MKIILSRKGFDSSVGELASPIIQPGRLLSLPIPVTDEKKEKGIGYNNLKFDGQCLSEIIEQLSKSKRNKFDTSRHAHLDPDLDRDRLESRRPGWRAAFGQVGQPQSFLKNVQAGDLFLFFGWFRHTSIAKGYLRYQSPVKELHVIFGWLQVEEIFRPGVTAKDCPMSVKDHPHVLNANADGYTSNTIYIAADKLTVMEQNWDVPGAGTFSCFKPSLQLTAPERPRSHWCLPRWFDPERPKGARADWPCYDNRIPFNSQAYGRCQEFVFNVPNCRGSRDWIRSLFDGEFRRER